MIGVTAGMRSLVTPSIVADRLSEDNGREFDDSPLAFMGSKKTASVLKVLGSLELVCDKLPLMPNRTDGGSLIFRFVSGAVCGAALCAAEGENAALGASIGGLTSILSAHACFNIRGKLVRDEIAPDVMVAVVEDALVFALGRTAVDRA